MPFNSIISVWDVMPPLLSLSWYTKAQLISLTSPHLDNWDIFWEQNTDEDKGCRITTWQYSPGSKWAEKILNWMLTISPKFSMLVSFMYIILICYCPSPLFVFYLILGYFFVSLYHNAGLQSGDKTHTLHWPINHHSTMWRHNDSCFNFARSE
jgi:hypothetical protein